MFKFSGLGGALVGALLVACAFPASAQSNSGDPTFDYLAGDAKMERAIEQARSSLPLFWSAWTRMGASAPSPSSFAVKAALPIPNVPGANEHIWVGAIRREGDVVRGALLNEPNDLGADFSRGSIVTFNQSQISDWWIQTEQGLHGAFTVRAMLDELPPEDAAQQRAMLAPEPLPDTKRD